MELTGWAMQTDWKILLKKSCRKSIRKVECNGRIINISIGDETPIWIHISKLRIIIIIIIIIMVMIYCYRSLARREAPGPLLLVKTKNETLNFWNGAAFVIKLLGTFQKLRTFWQNFELLLEVPTAAVDSRGVAEPPRGFLTSVCYVYASRNNA
jgi:hypothetical protein